MSSTNTPKGTDPIDTRDLPGVVSHMLRVTNCVTRDDVRRIGRDEFARFAGWGKYRLGLLDDLLGGVWTIIEQAPAVDDDPDPDIFCHNCVFYHESENECRRHAPRARVEADIKRDAATLGDENYDSDRINYAAWPWVEPRDWCGEWRRSGREPSDGWIVEGKEHPTDEVRNALSAQRLEFLNKNAGKD